MNVMSNGQSIYATNSTTVLSIATTSDCTSIEEDGSSTETALKSEGDPEESSETNPNVICELPSTSDTQSNAESCASSLSSSAKRKAALPKKRPYLSDQRLTISADTGEVLDDDINRRICLTTNNNNMHSYRSKRFKSIDKRIASNRYFKRPNSAFAGTMNDAGCDNEEIRAKNESRCHSVTCLYQETPPAIANNQPVISINQNLLNNCDILFRGGDSSNEVEPATENVQNGWNSGMNTMQNLLNNPFNSINSFSMANGLVDANILDSVGLGTATSLLPFLSTHFSELSTDTQSMQMALLEAATAAANSTISGIFGNASRSTAQIVNPVAVPKSTQDSGVASTSRDVSSDLIQSVLNNASDYLNDSLCLGIPLPQTAVGTTPNMSREDRIDLEELEVFAHNFKKQRIKFGFTQGDVGLALGRRYGTDFSQTTISRFEALNLSFKNMCKLRPLLKEWLSDAESAIASGATVNDLLDVGKTEAPVFQPNHALPLLFAPPIEEPSQSVGSSGIAVRKRRKRTNLDTAQRAALDAFFQTNPRPDHDSMAHIAAVLELDRDVVRVWFCNRRQKLRRS